METLDNIYFPKNNSKFNKNNYVEFLEQLNKIIINIFTNKTFKFNFNMVYTNIYNYCINIDLVKCEDVRIINNDINDNLINFIEELIITSLEKTEKFLKYFKADTFLDQYLIEYKHFVESLNICNKLFAYKINELKYNFVDFGLKKWSSILKNLNNKFFNFIINKINYYKENYKYVNFNTIDNMSNALDVDNFDINNLSNNVDVDNLSNNVDLNNLSNTIENKSYFDDELFLYNDVLENIEKIETTLNNIFDHINELIVKHILDIDFFKVWFTDNYVDYLQENFILLNETINKTDTYKEFISKIDNIYNNYNAINKIFSLNIIDSFDSIFKKTFITNNIKFITTNIHVLLTKLDIKKFKHSFSLNEELMENIYLSINHMLYDKSLCEHVSYVIVKYIKFIINEEFTLCYSKFERFEHFIDYVYFIDTIILEIKNKLLLNDKNTHDLYKTFEFIEEILINTIKKNSLEKIQKYIDVYIKLNIYSNKKVPLSFFSDYIEKYILRNDELVREEITVLYKKYLTQRLILYNFDTKYVIIEKSILSNITNVSGLFSKQLIMLNDIILSKTLSKELNYVYDSNCSFLALTDGIWNNNDDHFNLNNEFKTKFDNVKTNIELFYNCKYEKRKINWNYNLSSCVLAYTVNNKTYDLECNIEIANILTKFNEISEFSVNEINDYYNYKPILNFLTKMKLIILENDKYKLNETFVYKKNKVSLIAKYIKFKITKNNESDLDKTKSNNISRKNAIVFSQEDIFNAFVVRKMKHIETTTKDNLIDVIKTKFKDTELSFINKCLDKLVDQDFITYNSDSCVYDYVK